MTDTTAHAIRYTGRMTGSGAQVSRHGADGDCTPLPVRLDLTNHSPTGFAWGYGGSGPAQLALAILADAIGPDEALELYQDFKWDRIARIELDEGWEITRDQVLGWVAAARNATKRPMD